MYEYKLNCVPNVALMLNRNLSKNISAIATTNIYDIGLKFSLLLRSEYQRTPS